MTKPESRLTLITSSHRRSVLAALGALGTALATPAARAQSAWPAGKPIRLVIPSGPGGGADIFKCFDQIIRVLMLDLLAAGGFPPRLARAYKHFHLELYYRNTVAGGLVKHTGTYVASPMGARSA